MSNRFGIGHDESQDQPKAESLQFAGSLLNIPITPRSRLNKVDQSNVIVKSTKRTSRVSTTRTFFCAKRTKPNLSAPKYPARLSRPKPLIGLNAAAASKVQSITTVLWRFNIVNPQPFARPAHPKQQRSKVLHRRSVQRENKSDSLGC
jgi:hypothetical protein